MPPAQISNIPAGEVAHALVRAVSALAPIPDCNSVPAASKNVETSLDTARTSARATSGIRTAFVVFLFAASLAAQKQPFDVQTMLKIARIQEPALSPDGKTVAFTVQTVDIAQNSKPKQIYTVPVNGGLPRQITMQGAANERPEWSPDSSRIAFISDRGGSAQVWIMNADGSERAADHQPLNRSRRRVVFAGWQEAGVHERRVSELS